MDDVAIRVDNISKIYYKGQGYSKNLRETLSSLFTSKRKKEEFYALKDITFNVKHGEVVGIIGKNGVGKSTLLKVLSRITYPTTGSVELKGKVASLLEVGTGFHPELTGRENIFLNGSILGMEKKEIKKVFDEIVDFSGIENFIDTPVKRYSSGMYVRLAFSVAAHLRSDILLVDEVLTVGDIEFQNKSFKYLKEEAVLNKTVLLVSHNMQSIKRLCDKTIYLKDNTISSFEKTEIAVTQYLLDNTVSKDKISSKYIESIQLAGPGGSSKIFSQEIFDVKINYKQLVDKKPKYIRLEFYNQWNNIMFFCNNRIKKVPIKNNINSVLFSIESLPLYSGQYYIKIYLADEFLYVDEVENYVTFHVKNRGQWEPKKHNGINIDFTVTQNF